SLLDRSWNVNRSAAWHRLPIRRRQRITGFEPAAKRDRHAPCPLTDGDRRRHLPGGRSRGERPCVRDRYGGATDETINEGGGVQSRRQRAGERSRPLDRGDVPDLCGCGIDTGAIDRELNGGSIDWDCPIGDI